MGQLSEQELGQVQRWVVQYPEVAAELKSIEMALETYAQASGILPAESVKDKVLTAISSASVNESPIIRPSFSAKKNFGRSAGFWKWAAAASFLLLIGSTVFTINFYTKYTQAESKWQQTENQLAYERQRADEMKADMSIFRSKYSEPVALKGMDAAPDAAAKIFWMKNTGEVYIDPSNLPDAPKGKQYQLWAIVDGKPVDAGMIFTSKKGDKYRIQKMKTFGKAQAFAVTLEKEGGVESPSMDQMYVMGKI